MICFSPRSLIGFYELEIDTCIGDLVVLFLLLFSVPYRQFITNLVSWLIVTWYTSFVDRGFGYISCNSNFYSGFHTTISSFHFTITKLWLLTVKFNSSYIDWNSCHAQCLTLLAAPTTPICATVTLSGRSRHW